MKILIVAVLLSLIACKESECDKQMKEVQRLEKEYLFLKSQTPNYSGKEMEMARVAAYKAIAKYNYDKCVNGE